MPKTTRKKRPKVVQVKSYTRADGKQIKGYKRSKPKQLT
jgi:hypothetical protein